MDWFMKVFILEFLTKRFRFFSRYIEICPSWVRIYKWQWTNGFVYQSDVLDSYGFKEGIKRFLKNKGNKK